MKKEELITHKNKLDFLESEIRKQGFRGEAKIPKLIYLAGISRHFNQPVSCVVFGPSGSGKSYAVNAGLQFIDPDALISVTGITEQFLAYPGKTDFKHKVLFLGEAAGMADGQGRTNLRQFLTEGAVKHATVQKDSSGQMISQITEAAVGPTAFMMTTTAGGIHHEDQSRMLALEISEDRGRVKEALHSQARRQTPESIKLDLEAWHELDVFVGNNPKNVDIPYAEKLADAVPTDRQKIIRDFPKVLALVDAHVLIHQTTRDRGENGEVIATELDYKIVYDLVEGYLRIGLEHDVAPGVRAVIDAVSSSKSGQKHSSGLSQSEIVTRTGQERSTASRNINKAVFEGYLVDKNPGQGKASEIVLGDRELSVTEVLPHPDKLFGRDWVDEAVDMNKSEPIRSVSTDIPWSI